MDLGISEDEVKTVVMEYWTSIYNNILNLDSTTVSIRHIGNFTISRYKLRNFLSNHIKRYKKVKVLENKEKLLYSLMFKIDKASEKRNVLAEHYYKKNQLNELKKQLRGISESS